MTKVVVTTRNSDPQLMAWDAEFWGVRMGRATNLDGLSQWAVENTVGMVCLLVSTDKPGEIQEAEEHGFRFMDVRTTLERTTVSCGSGARLAKLEDLPVIRSIARTAFPLTRFYADPRLDDERCADLYEEWVRSSFAGAADVVLVAERDEAVVGFITVNLDKPRSEIGLIAVADDYRGQRIGHDLISGAVDWAHKQDGRQMSVVTQGRNIGALRAFETCGFKIAKTEVWLHRWYDA